MKKLFSPDRHWLFLLLLIVTINGCSRPSSDRPGVHTLSWSFNGVNYIADEVDAYAASNVIIATKDLSTPASMKNLEIMLIDPNNTFEMGSYSFDISSHANVVHYTVGNGGAATALYSTDGTLTITSKTGNVISGNFSVTLVQPGGGSGGGVMTGSFSNVSID